MRVMGIIPPPTCMRRWARAASDRYFRSVCAYVCDPGKNGGVAFEDLPDDRRKRGDAEIVLRLVSISCFKAIPHNSARADPEKIWVLIKALFRRCT